MIKKYNQFINEGLKDYLTGPTDEDIKNYYKQEFLDGNIRLYDYINKTKKLKFDSFTFEELKDFYNKQQITLDDFISASYRLGYTELCKEELDDKIEEILKEAIEHNLSIYRITNLKTSLKLTNSYILSKTKNFSINDKMILCAELLLISELKKCIENGADISYNHYDILYRLNTYSLYNKKAIPLRDYILSLIPFPDNYEDYIDDYFSGCELKKIKIQSRILSALVKNDNILIYSELPYLSYLMIDEKFYHVMGNIYNSPHATTISIIKDYLIKHNLNIGLFNKENEYVSISITDFKDVESILNEGLNDYLIGPTKEEIELNLKQKFLSKKINLINYCNKAKEYGVSGPTEKEKWEYYGYDNPITFDEFLSDKCINLTTKYYSDYEAEPDSTLTFYYNGVKFFEYDYGLRKLFLIKYIKDIIYLLFKDVSKTELRKSIKKHIKHTMDLIIDEDKYEIYI